MLNASHSHSPQHLSMLLRSAVALLLVVVTPACGGAVESSSSPDSGINDAGAMPEADADGNALADAPAVDSPACDMPDGPCILCKDDLWHCGSATFQPCPQGLQLDASCIGAIPQTETGNDCFTCDGSNQGYDWHCTNVNPQYGYWELNPYSCSQ
jgi:hypothetical protein